MTPAILPGYRARIDCDSGQPRLMPSSTDFVQGVLVFGQGRKGRDRIHEHYRSHARRTKVLVEADMLVPVPICDRTSYHERWRLQRHKVKAHAWISSLDGCNVHPVSCPETPGWTLEHYLSGAYEAAEDLCIDASAYDLEEDGGVSLPSDTYEEKEEPLGKGIVYEGYGTIAYERVEEVSGRSAKVVASSSWLSCRPETLSGHSDALFATLSIRSSSLEN